jgi:hypothetical protein
MCACNASRSSSRPRCSDSRSIPPAPGGPAPHCRGSAPAPRMPRSDSPDGPARPHERSACDWRMRHRRSSERRLNRLRADYEAAKAQTAEIGVTCEGSLIERHITRPATTPTAAAPIPTNVTAPTGNCSGSSRARSSPSCCLSAEDPPLPRVDRQPRPTRSRAGAHARPIPTSRRADPRQTHPSDTKPRGYHALPTRREIAMPNSVQLENEPVSPTPSARVESRSTRVLVLPRRRSQCTRQRTRLLRRPMPSCDGDSLGSGPRRSARGPAASR